MAKCTIDFQGTKYDLDDFKNLLGKGLLYDLMDRGVVDLPINREEVKPTTPLKGFEQNFPTTKQNVEKSLIQVFKLPADQAKAVADVYHRVARAWAVRNNRSIADYFKTLSIFKGDEKTLTPDNYPALYTQEQKAQLQKEIDDVRANTKSFKLFKAPNGKKTNLTEEQWLTVQTPTFKKWFGDSKAVDENGDPKVFYHGSIAKFDTFDPNITGNNRGIFLTPEIDFALDYTTKNAGSNFHNVLELFVKANKPFDYENPKDITLLKNILGEYTANRIQNEVSSNNWGELETPKVQEFLRNNNYDSYYVKEQGIKNLAVYEPTQVKVSDGRNQTFAEDNPNMLFQDVYHGGVGEPKITENKNFISLSTDRGFAQRYANQWLNGVLRKYNLNSDNLFDYNNFDHLQKLKNYSEKTSQFSLYSDLFKDKVMNGEDVKVDANNNWRHIENSSFQKFLKSEGFDGFYMKEHGVKNIGLFKENLIIPLQDILNQQLKGAILLGQDGKDIIYALTNPDVSTPLHELAHRWERELNDTERKQVLDWTKHDTWSRETSEKFARGFEKYLADGKAPVKGLQNLFDRFKQWLIDIYKGIKSSAIDVELNEQMKKIYSDMLGENYEPKITEELQQEAANEATPVTSQEPTVQKPQTEQQPQVQPVQQVPAPEDIQTWTKPYTGEQKDIISYKIDVQQAYRNNSYDELVKNGEMSEEELNNIFTSAGMSSQLAATVVFRATNKGLQYSVDSLMELSVDPDATQDFQRVSNHFISSGRLEEAIKNDMISPEDAKELLKNTITQTTDLRDQKDALVKLADEKINSEPKVTVAEPDTEVRISDADRRIAELKAALGETKPAVEEVGLDDLPAEERQFFPISKDEGIRSEKLPKGSSPELINRQSVIVKVAERIRKVLPSIAVDLIFDDAQWKGRIKDGKVEINLNYADKNTPIHELMHPFVLALRNGNSDLHFNLTQELRTGDYAKYIDDVANDPNYNKLSINDREDEALTRYLGDSVEQYFKADGTIDLDKVNMATPAFKAFMTWLTDIIKQFWDRISGSKPGAKLKGIQQVDYIIYKKDTGKISGYKARSKEERVDEAGKKIKERDNRSFDVHIDDTEGLKNRGFTDESIMEIREAADETEATSITINRNDLTLPKRTIEDKDPIRGPGMDVRPSIDVSDLPVNFTLQNVVDVIGAQERVSFDFSAQQSAIDKLEAYQFQDKAQMDEFFKKLDIRMNVLTDAERRIGGDTEIVKNNIVGLKKILRDYKGVQAVSEYIQYGIRGLEGASWLIRNVDETLSKARQGLVQARDAKGKPTWIKSTSDPLTEELVNRLNKQVLEARTLFGFYDDVRYLYNTHSEFYTDKELDYFRRIFDEAQDKSRHMGKTMNDLVTDWLYPTLEKSQANLPEERRLTREQLSRKLRFADQDVSNISYWMGSVVNSRDPVNAILAILIKDKLSAHHESEAEVNLTLRQHYNEFLKRTGTENTPKAYEKYAKENYLRQAKIWEVIGFNEETGEKTYGYVDRWAFHEKHLMDKYDDDLRLFKEQYENTHGKPTSEKDWDAHNKAIGDWIFANSPDVNPTKYVNPMYDKVSADPYYAYLYKTYKDSNVKYGERKLNFGIIPQAYKKTSQLRNIAKDVKGLPKYFKDVASDKSKSIPGKLETGVHDLGNYLFDQDQYMREQDLNLDGSYYRGVNSPFTHLIDQNNLDFRLNESVLGFQSAANTFASLREVQANIENFKMLMEGNTKFSIQGRQIANRDKNGKILFDRFLKRPENQYATKLNKQVTSFVNDIFYGDGEFQTNVSLGKVNINLNSAGRQLGFLTALQNMAGNVFAGISNVTIGNAMSLGEAVGSKYYSPKNWGWAQKEYWTNAPRFLADVTNPVKSKATQLGILYDAIQGEFRDKYGKNITGNVMNRYATNDSFFIINHTGEHQIQLVGMLALMDATKVKLRDGSTVSLYDAYQKNTKGFYKIREDAIWDQSNNEKFIKTLHGISRDLNGNYAAFDKSMLQRYWWGKLALQYRKYLYSAWRSRFAGERVDYERGDLQTGYYRQFLSKFWQDTKDYNGNALKSIYNAATGKGFSKDEAYARRKTLFDISLIVGTTMVAAGLAGMEKDDDAADKQAKDRLLLSMLRLRSDVSQYSWTLPAEVVRTINNPSASLNLVKNYGNFISQLLNDPAATYAQNGSGYNAGDSKLGQKAEKLIPLYRQWLRWQTPDEQVKYYSLINKNVQPF